MNLEPAGDMSPEQWIIDEHIGVDCILVRFDEYTWEIHGHIPVDGEVLVAQYPSRDEAEAALRRIVSAESPIMWRPLDGAGP